MNNPCGLYMLLGYIASVRPFISDGLETGQGSLRWDDVPRTQIVIFGTSL